VERYNRFVGSSKIHPFRFNLDPCSIAMSANLRSRKQPHEELLPIKAGSSDSNKRQLSRPQPQPGRSTNLNDANEKTGHRLVGEIPTPETEFRPHDIDT
jgi:hypothetical protein